MIHFELTGKSHPIACGSVVQLAERKYLTEEVIERLEPGFVLQPLFLMVLIHRSDIMVEPEFKTNPRKCQNRF
ncbi:MAG: hypothetical protein ACLR2O_07840 [Coprococcus sp.]